MSGLVAVTPVNVADRRFMPGEVLPDKGVDRDRLLRLGAAREQDRPRRRPAKPGS